jgi:hypothetical protein
MKAEGHFITWVIAYQTTRHFIQEFRNLHGGETLGCIEVENILSSSSRALSMELELDIIDQR